MGRDGRTLTLHYTTTETLLGVLRMDAEPALRTLGEREWDALADAAERHALMPLVWHRIQQRAAESLPPADVRRRFEVAQTLAGLRAEAWSRQLVEVLESLCASEVPVVLLKGAFLARHVYEAPRHRPLGDLDLLVPARQLGTAMEAIAGGAGYTMPSAEEWEEFRAHRHPPPLRRRGRLPVELHETIEPCAPPFKLPLEDVWSRARTTTPSPESSLPALALAPEDLLLHLATHMGHSHLLGSSLVRICDVALWTQSFGHTADWDVVIRHARTAGVRRFVHTSLELAHRLFGANFPHEVERALHDPANDPSVEAAIALLDERPRNVISAVSLTRAGSWQRLSRVACTLLVPLPRAADAAARAKAHELLMRRAAYRARWDAFRHYLGNPAEARAALRRIGRVRRLRNWAAGSD